MYFYNDPEEFEIILKKVFKSIHDNARFETMLRPSMGIYIVEENSEDIHIMLNKARTAHETVKYTEDSIVAYYDAGFRDKKYQSKHMEKKLDKSMFVQVCNLQKKLMEYGVTPVSISVNVSRQLLYDQSFADYYCNYMKEIDIPADLVELEIPESAFFEDIDLFRSTLEKLRKFGFRILMDDFGTGYSSLMMLHSVPIDVIKAIVLIFAVVQ